MAIEFHLNKGGKGKKIGIEVLNSLHRLPLHSRLIPFMTGNSVNNIGQVDEWSRTYCSNSCRVRDAFPYSSSSSHGYSKGIFTGVSSKILSRKGKSCASFTVCHVNVPDL